MTEKHPGGRPLKYKTREELQAAIDDYFDELDGHNAAMVLAKVDNNYRPYTISGLAYSIDLTRQGLIEYSQKKSGEYSDTIRKAKARIERFNEEQLYRNGQVTGTIFNLKNNFGWKDKTEQELSGNIGLSGILGEIDGRASSISGIES